MQKKTGSKAVSTYPVLAFVCATNVLPAVTFLIDSWSSNSVSSANSILQVIQLPTVFIIIHAKSLKSECLENNRQELRCLDHALRTFSRKDWPLLQFLQGQQWFGQPLRPRPPQERPTKKGMTAYSISRYAHLMLDLHNSLAKDLITKVTTLSFLVG